jgi:mono/diheme cytochrome c family protein
MQLKLKKFKAIAFPAILLVGIVACSPGPGDKPGFEYMPDMQDAPSVKAQEQSMRSPVAGTLPRGFQPYPFIQDEAVLAGRSLRNPLPRAKAVMLRGQEVYNNTCVVCHGPKGKGNGYIVPKFPQPPTLLSEKIHNWPDGRLFHVITKGQNLMGSYASQIAPDDRWAIVHYVRALQRAGHPTEADIRAYQKALKEGTIP